MAAVNVHRVRFIECRPKAIHCLAFSDDPDRPPRLSVSRGDASLEIWATCDGERFHQETWVPGREDSSVEALVWCQGRLFSSGLTGLVLEWDLERLRPRHRLDCSGGAVWCLVPNADRTVLAGGCEDGQVRLYNVTADGLQFMRGLDKQEGRVLSLACHPGGKYMAVGGADSIIRKVNVNTGRCVQRITMDDYKLGKTLVWDLQYLSDNTIVSADSGGKILFWNGKHGTLKQSVHLHQADVLTLALNAAEDTIFASGVDSLIVKLQRLPTDPSKWVKTEQSRTHTHDVRSLALSTTGVLASGGVDTQLGLCSANHLVYDDTVRNLPFCNYSRFFSVAPAAHVLMFQDSLSLTFWKLKELALDASTGTPDKEGPLPRGNRKKRTPVCSTVNLDSSAERADVGMPVNLLEITSKGPLHLLSSAISRDASLLAFSNIEQFWLYALEHSEEKDPKVRCLYTVKEPCYKLTFTPDGLQLVLATISDGVKLIDLVSKKGDNGSPSYKTTVLVPPGKPSSKSSRIIDLLLSQDGHYAAMVNLRRRISVYDLKSKDVIVKLPRIDGQPVVFCFVPDKPKLVLFSGRDREIFTYDFSEESLTSFGAFPFERKFHSRERLQHPLAIFPFPAEPDVFGVYDNDFMVITRLTEQVTHKPRAGSKRKRRDVTHHPRYQSVVLSGNLLCAASLEDSGVVTVERRWVDVVKLFPPALMRDKYGT